MKVLSVDWKKNFVKFKVEDPDDLWDLSLLIEEEDVLTGKAERKIRLGSSSENYKVSKVSAVVSLRVEKVKFEGDVLRVNGVIVDGPENFPLGSHQNLELKAGYVYSLVKRVWLSFQKERFLESEKRKVKLLVVLFDGDSALFSFVSSKGVEVLEKLRGGVSKKDVKVKSDGSFFRLIVKTLLGFFQSLKPDFVLLASPPFWSSYVKRLLSSEIPVVVSSCSSVTEAGVYEVLRRPELKTLLQNEINVRESGFVELIKESLAKGSCSYGLDDVERKVLEGNVKSVFVSKSSLLKWRDSGLYPRVEKLLRTVESLGGEVHVIVNQSDFVDSLGGVVSVDRWKS